MAVLISGYIINLLKEYHKFQKWFSKLTDIAFFFLTTFFFSNLNQMAVTFLQMEQLKTPKNPSAKKTKNEFK